MGYRSDVALAVAIPSMKTMLEVLSVYRMHPNVQKENLLEDYWQLKMPEMELHNGDKQPICVLFYKVDDIKWYDGYEDVEGMSHINTVCKQFAEERGDEFDYAYWFVRIGEQEDDIETVGDYTDTDIGHEMFSCLQDIIWVTREVQTDDNLPDVSDALTKSFAQTVTA